MVHLSIIRSLTYKLGVVCRRRVDITLHEAFKKSYRKGKVFGKVEFLGTDTIALYSNDSDSDRIRIH